MVGVDGEAVLHIFWIVADKDNHYMMVEISLDYICKRDSASIRHFDIQKEQIERTGLHPFQQRRRTRERLHDRIHVIVLKRADDCARKDIQRTLFVVADGDVPANHLSSSLLSSTITFVVISPSAMAYFTEPP